MEVSIEALIADRDSHLEQASAHQEQAEAINNYLRLRGYIEAAPRGKRPFRPRPRRPLAPINKLTERAKTLIKINEKFERKELLKRLSVGSKVSKEKLAETTDSMLGRGYPFKNLSHGLYIRVDGEDKDN